MAPTCPRDLAREAMDAFDQDFVGELLPGFGDDPSRIQVTHDNRGIRLQESG